MRILSIKDAVKHVGFTEMPLNRRQWRSEENMTEKAFRLTTGGLFLSYCHRKTKNIVEILNFF